MAAVVAAARVAVGVAQRTAVDKEATGAVMGMAMTTEMATATARATDRAEHGSTGG
jgi:hypothetical protein